VLELWTCLCQRQIGAILVDGSGADTRYGAILFVEQETGVGVGEGYMAVRGHRAGKLRDDDQRILVVALKSQRLAIRAFYFLHDEVWMQLDAHAAGGFHGFEINLRRGGKGLANSVQRRGDVVVVGEKSYGPRRLGMERRGGANKKH